MINVKDVRAVYLATGVSDLRKSIDGLAAIVQEQFKLDPFAPALFVFCNKNKDKLKILHWEHAGFWLYYRRLEKGKFRWPNDESNTVQIDLKELKWLLYGYGIRRGNALKEVKQRSVI